MSEAWPEWAVNVVRAGWERGDPASRIAADLGHKWSRNSVIGKAHRMKLPRRAPVPPPRPPRERPKKVASVRAPKLHRNYEPDTPVLKPEPLPPPRVDDATIPLAQRKQLLDLTPRCCRWPVGEPSEASFFFCGGVAVEGSPYCGSHTRRAYVAR